VGRKAPPRGAIYGRPSALSRIVARDRSPAAAPPAARPACSDTAKPLHLRVVFSRVPTDMRAVLDVLLIALNIYVWLIIAQAVLSWLIAFNVVNTRNQFVATVWDFLYRITEPALRPIRNFMPNLGGLDISPIILILIIYLIERIIIYYIYPNVF
jgi:YggT family protein